MAGNLAGFWSWQLIAAIVLNGFVQCILIGAYAARIAGATSGRIASAMSFYNVVTMVSRLAAFFYTPLLGVLSDHAAKVAAASATHTFEWQLRAIVFVGALGAGVGALLLPTFTHWFMRGIRAFERTGSLPRVALKLFVPRTAYSVLSSFQIPDGQQFRGLHLRHISPHLLLFNVVVTSIYAISMVGATYASVLDPTAARTALLSTGLINAVAMVSFVFVVDPSSAYMTDMVTKGERSVDDVRRLMVFLSLTTVVGLLVAQFLLVPAAEVVIATAKLFMR